VQAFITLGLSLVLENLALLLFSNNVVTTSTFLGENSLILGSVHLADTYVVSACAAVVITVALWLWLQRTDFGRAVRAIAQNPMAAQLQGINDDRVYMVTFTIGTGLAGLGGALYAPISAIFPGVGFTITIVAFVVVVLGGMGSLPGAFFAALIIGLTESLSSYYFGANSRQIVYFLVFVAVLVMRPSGLLGIRGAELVGYR
jgi:branched-chain amino acid transport system permease protein